MRGFTSSIYNAREYEKCLFRRVIILLNQKARKIKAKRVICVNGRVVWGMLNYKLSLPFGFVCPDTETYKSHEIPP